MTPTFEQHMALAQQHPAYWSYLMTAEFIDSLVAEMDVKGVSGAELARRMARRGPGSRACSPASATSPQPPWANSPLRSACG